MGRKSRASDMPTVIELYREYFNKQMYSPLSTPAQAVMSHIIWLCNENYGVECRITYKQLAARVNVDVRTVKAKFQELCDKEYITYTEINREVCMIRANLLQISAQNVGVSTESAFKEREENRKKDIKNKVVNLNVESEVPGWGNFKKQF